MKKIVLGFSVLMSLFALAACQSNSKSQVETEEHLQARVIVDFGDKVDKKEITFEKGDTVMDILEEHYEVEEEVGLVLSIDGVSQDASKNTYWLYDVNDEMAPKGAEEMTISEGDTIHFYLETFDN